MLHRCFNIFMWLFFLFFSGTLFNQLLALRSTVPLGPESLVEQYMVIVSFSNLFLISSRKIRMTTFVECSLSHYRCFLLRFIKLAADISTENQLFKQPIELYSVSKHKACSIGSSFHILSKTIDSITI